MVRTQWYMYISNGRHNPDRWLIFNCVAVRSKWRGYTDIHFEEMNIVRGCIPPDHPHWWVEKFFYTFWTNVAMNFFHYDQKIFQPTIVVSSSFGSLSWLLPRPCSCSAARWALLARHCGRVGQSESRLRLNQAYWQLYRRRWLSSDSYFMGTRFRDDFWLSVIIKWRASKGLHTFIFLSWAQIKTHHTHAHIHTHIVTFIQRTENKSEHYQGRWLTL